MQTAEPNSSQARKYRVFVTGATGLVGSHLVRALVAQGHSVVAMVRDGSDLRELKLFAREAHPAVEIVCADLLQTDLIAQYARGCDAVVHCAAAIHPHGEAKYLHRINVGGTRNVLHAAITAGVTHFLHISSLSVIMGEEDCYGATEDAPLKYCREAYANSKVDAERIVMSAEAQRKIHVTALRPGFIYGPNEKTWLPKVIGKLRAGTMLLVGDGKKETNLIYVENLCRAILLSLLNPVAFGQVYNLTDGEVVTKRQLLNVICNNLDIARVRIVISISMARLLVGLSSALAACAPASLRPYITFSRPALRLVALNQGFDISKAERDLNYTDRIAFVDAMARTLQSYRTFSPQSVGDAQYAARAAK